MTISRSIHVAANGIILFFFMAEKYFIVYMYIHTHTHTRTHTMEYYSAIKKNEIMPFAATWMDLEIIILTQKEKDKCRITSPIGGI